MSPSPSIPSPSYADSPEAAGSGRVTAQRPLGLAASPRERSRVPAATRRPAAEHLPSHAALVCVAAPDVVISQESGQLTGEGLDGFYQGGRRVLGRCQLLLGGREPVPLESRMLGAGQALFTAVGRTVVGAAPDPEIVVERLRSADGTERVTARNAGVRTVLLPVELRMGTDLSEFAAVAAGRAGRACAASVHGSGLSWESGGLRATVSADPAPDTSWAQAGLVRWEWRLAPGTSRTVVLRIGLARSGAAAGRSGRGSEVRAGDARRTERPPSMWPDAAATGDDRRVGALFRTAVQDAQALLLRDPVNPSDVHLAAGVPWRCALAPAEALRAARMLLPLGTRLASGTLRTLARAQCTGPGRDHGRLPGPLRQAGPFAPPSCTGVEATLLFPVVLAEARRWGLPERETVPLLPAAQRCLDWLLRSAGSDGYVPDPAPSGPYRCEVQAGAHRAALLGAELLEAYGRSGAAELREWAAGLRGRFAADFWGDGGRHGGAPLALLGRNGAPVGRLGAAAAELLDTGLAGGGQLAEGLLTLDQRAQLAVLLSGPSLESGWGPRSLGRREPQYNPFGHRSGAVRVQEAATAVAGLAGAGHEDAAGTLLRGVLDAAEHFGMRLPEMYAAPQRADGGTPLPHPAACRPAAVAAAGAVQLLTALAGVRPDVPGGTVSVRPVTTAPLGAVEFTGLRVAEQPFSVRVSRLGMGLVQEAGGGLQLVR